MQAGRVILDGVTSELVPSDSTIWQCACDTDGCWPGCFTIASATVLEYWAKRGYPALDDGDSAATFARLRELFPNLFCYDNTDNDGKPGESGYDAFDVAKGFDIFIRERGYTFKITPIPNPSFEQIVAEIDAGRPVIGAFGRSPWGSHAGTIIGYDNTDGKRTMIVRPNLAGKLDTELTWNVGYGAFGIVTAEPASDTSDLAQLAKREIQIQIDDTESGFVLSGEWTLREGLGVNNTARVTRSTDPSNLGPLEDTALARWTPNLPYDGMYEVQAFMPYEDGEAEDGNTHLATYHVGHAEGMSLIRRSQHDAKPGWMPLGIFPFVRGDKGFVKLGNRTGDQPPRSVWADAIRFVFKAPLVVQRDGGPAAVVIDGKALELPDPDTIDALKLRRVPARALDSISYAQYTPGAAPISVYSGWVAQYFDNATLTPPFSVLRTEPSVNHAWGGAAPAAGLPGRGFSARYSRMLALTEGEYPFVLEATGPVRLFVDGKLVIDAWDTASAQFLRHEASVQLISGLHRISIEYSNPASNAARLRFGNLPPNAPVVLNNANASAVLTTTASLRWLDSGDPDSVASGNARRFFATLWRDDGFRRSTGWITDTAWTVRLPEDGLYRWNVIASDGNANSAASAPQTILLDTTPPWSQMLSASPAMGRLDPSAQTNNSGLRLETDANGVQVVVDSGPTSVSDSPNRLVVLDRALHRQFGKAPAARLTWWATDTLSLNDATYVLQARELIQARTEYTLTTITREVPKIGYALVLSGSQEITQEVMLTDTLQYTDVTPLLVVKPVENAEWITVSTSLKVTETVFIGMPGSTYELRVRAIDGLGNEQRWYDGYAIQVKFDEETMLPRGVKALSLYDMVREQLVEAPLDTPSARPISATAPVSAGLALTLAVAFTDTVSAALTETLALTATAAATGTATPTATVPVGESVWPTPFVMPTIPVEGAGPVPISQQSPTPRPDGVVPMPTIAPFTPVLPTPTPTVIPLPSPTETPAPATSTPEPTLAPSSTPELPHSP
jgi:hypothetical protein